MHICILSIFFFIFSHRKNFQGFLISNVSACWGWQSHKSELHLLPQRCYLFSNAHTTFWNEDHTSDLWCGEKNPGQNHDYHNSRSSSSYVIPPPADGKRAAAECSAAALCPIVIIRLWVTLIGISHEEERLYLSAIFHPNLFESSVEKVWSKCGTVADRSTITCPLD